MKKEVLEFLDTLSHSDILALTCFLSIENAKLSALARETGKSIKEIIHDKKSARKLAEEYLRLTLTEKGVVFYDP